MGTINVDKRETQFIYFSLKFDGYCTCRLWSLVGPIMICDDYKKIAVSRACTLISDRLYRLASIGFATFGVFVLAKCAIQHFLEIKRQAASMHGLESIKCIQDF